MAAKWPQLLPSAMFAINPRRISLMGGVEISISPLESLTVVRPRNEAEAELTNLLGEPSVLEDHLPRLAHLDSLHDEWTEHSREAKMAATTKFIRKELKAESECWCGAERREEERARS